MEKHASSTSLPVDIKSADYEANVVPADVDHDANHGMLRDANDATATVRGLKGRHLQLIGIGAAIGTGLFLGSARALIYGGPLGST